MEKVRVIFPMLLAVFLIVLIVLMFLLGTLKLVMNICKNPKIKLLKTRKFYGRKVPCLPVVSYLLISLRRRCLYNALVRNLATLKTLGCGLVIYGKNLRVLEKF